MIWEDYFQSFYDFIENDSSAPMPGMHFDILRMLHSLPVYLYRMHMGSSHAFMKEHTINTIKAEWLPVILAGSFSEIYVINCATMHFDYVNPAAVSNLQYDLHELQGMTPADITHTSDTSLYARLCVQLAQGAVEPLAIRQTHIRKDGSRYPIEHRIFRLTGTGANDSVMIAIGNDVSQRDLSSKALHASESRLKAMVSNMPGLVYQFSLDHQQQPFFPYLSDGCEALLGISAEALHASPELFLDLILEQDQPSYLDTMQASCATMSNWNWEGRIHIKKWNDIKWINLRATPRTLDDHTVQWEGIMTNITTSRMEQQEIISSRAQLAELSDHINTVKEQERTRIAREIHDDLGGNMTAIKMAVTLLARRLPPRNHELREKADYVELLVDRTIETVRQIAGDLRPGVLDFGLVAAVEWQAEEFEKQSGIPCRFVSNKPDIELDLDRATALFRIFQEALTNIARHAHASRVSVQLTHTEDCAQLQIADNGCGIDHDMQHKPKSFGIRGMTERAMALGGKLSIGPTDGGGTTVIIAIPLPAIKS